ncbi:MAG: hypothetical protein RIF32_11670 [Leptospirales bacterium]|jgi:cell division septal protein FtsQ
MGKRILQLVFFLFGAWVGLWLFVLIFSTQPGPQIPFIYEAF